MGICYCYKCEKYFHHLEIDRHRAMHRDRSETVKISYTYGVAIHDYAKEENEDERT